MHNRVTAGMGKNDIVNVVVSLRLKAQILIKGATNALHILKADVLLNHKNVGEFSRQIVADCMQIG